MSLNAAYDHDNIFAKILRGELPCAKVYEDENCLSFMDAFPQTKGHTLIIPKAPCRNLLDIEPDQLPSLIQKTQMIAKAVTSALSPDGIIITQFNGAPAGQTVFHLHFHIIPRYNNHSTQPHASGQMADIRELNKLAAQIRAAL